MTPPFPYFGGKRRAVAAVWPRFGLVDNYVEPFCGGLAMLLGVPRDPRRTETANDRDGFLVNFWRAIQTAPEAVAHWADWPVSEADLEARHGWLLNRAHRLRWSLEDPDFCDAKIAGWWVWGLCAWIGSGWCSGVGPWTSNGVMLEDRRKVPPPSVRDQGINRSIPHLSRRSRGINRRIPHLTRGRGINRKTPQLERRPFILHWFTDLSIRLRDLRITCGDWTHVVPPAVTSANGTTAIFMDPPYAATKTKAIYGAGECPRSISTAVGQWCREHGHDPKLRIVLCGYAGEHHLAGWTRVRCPGGGGGYGTRPEYLWLSPHCIRRPMEARP
jgi:hypothetical protein